MKRSVGIGALLVACAMSCGSQALPSDRVGVSTSDIQGGSTDTTHSFAVGVVQLAQAQQNMVAFCSGVLLAPNLVATARHCVAELTSTTIDCATSTFGPLFPADQVFVTTDSTITMSSNFVGVTSVIVPTGTNQTAVCGNDIALMILDQNIDLPEYVEPVIQPPMTSAQYEAIVTAIGYGIDTPTDTTGDTAGTRRIRENVQLTCIPNDTAFTDCFSDPVARQVLTSGEFVSGDSTCEGDSGSGAFEQSNFDMGKWVAFGVLSRGGVSTDGTTCEQPIYTRFDAWASLIIGAEQKAQMAEPKADAYPLPAWAGGSVALADAGVATVEPGDGAAGLASGATADAATEHVASASGGCSVASLGSSGGTPWRKQALVGLLGLGWAAASARRRRGSVARQARH
jgi:MYXO-CTERM domain-containing protein